MCPMQFVNLPSAACNCRALTEPCFFAPKVCKANNAKNKPNIREIAKFFDQPINEASRLLGESLHSCIRCNAVAATPCYTVAGLCKCAPNVLNFCAASGRLKRTVLTRGYHVYVLKIMLGTWPVPACNNATGICPTLLKKICRRHGVKRWPNRRLRSLERQMFELKAVLDVDAQGLGTHTIRSAFKICKPDAAH